LRFRSGKPEISRMDEKQDALQLISSPFVLKSQSGLRCIPGRFAFFLRRPAPLWQSRRIPVIACRTVLWRSGRAASDF
jgi:hypothetical protein